MFGKLCLGLWILILICGIFSPISVVIIILKAEKQMPEKYEINLCDVIGQFDGRILPANEVQPGTFAIIKNFEETKTWGKDAIMSFGILSERKAILNAWRPDAQTSGAFEKSSKQILVPENIWDHRFAIWKIEKTGQKLVILPEVSQEWSSQFAAVIFIFGLSVILSVVTYKMVKI